MTLVVLKYKHNKERKIVKNKFINTMLMLSFVYFTMVKEYGPFEKKQKIFLNVSEIQMLSYKTKSTTSLTLTGQMPFDIKGSSENEKRIKRAEGLIK